MLAFQLFAQPLNRQPPVTLPMDEASVSLRGRLAFLRDSSLTRPLADVSRPAVDSTFRPVTSPVPNFGFISSKQNAPPVWLRFRVLNPGRQAQTWLARIDFWCFDALQLFVLDAGNQILSVSPLVGWKIPVAQRPKQHRAYWLPFTIPTGQTVTVYLRVLKHRGAQIVPIELVRDSGYEPAIQRDYLFWGGVLFTLVFVVIMSLFFWLTLRERIYGKYVVCLLGLLGFFFINNGFMNQFAFDSQFWLPRQNVYFLFPLILFYSQLYFVRTFLSLHQTSVQYWHTISTVGMGCGLFCLLSLMGEFIVPYSPATEQVLLTLFVVFYWLPLPIIGAYIIQNIRRRYRVREAWLYLVAIGPFYALNLSQTLASLGLLPTYPFIADFVNFALAALFEVLVLSFGLAYHYKLSRDQTEQLIQERNRQQQRTFEAEVQTLGLKNRLLVEKERIARDLHDNVGAHLAFVVTNLTHISDQAEKKPIADGRRWAGQLRSIVGHTREAVKLLRETIWAIHQETFTVEEFGERLDQYINRYFHDINGLQVDIRVTGSQTQRLSSMQVLNLFRIVQEALNNVVKHARATSAVVVLHVASGGRISLRIHDDGQGFTYANGWSSGGVSEQHYGLQNMQTRAEELGGSFRVFSENGTTIEVEV